MSLLIVELHGMDISCVGHMPFLTSVAPAHPFRTYTGLAGSAGLWRGTTDVQAGSDYHDHFWDGSSGYWDLNILRLLRGDLHFSNNVIKDFRVTRTKGYFQDSEIFKKFDYSFSERPIIATNKSFKLDFAKDERRRVEKFKKYWNKTLNFIRLNRIDRLSHAYGPDSEQAINYSKYLDKLLEEIFQEYKGNIVVFAITGMMNAHRKVNVIHDLKNLNGLVFFVDDENIRIWNTGNNAVVEKALDYIENLKCGEWVKDKPDRKFGDYFYRAHDGVAFAPNNYVKKDIAGIHTRYGWMVSQCGTVDHITEFKDLITRVCSSK